jgi:tetratricopeptide (TPR) repeat protein
MKGERMRTPFLPWIIALLAFPAVGLAAADADSAASRDPVLQQAQEAASRQDYAAAAAILRDAVARTPDNAEYHNLYAYALRKGPHPDMDLVFKHYNDALRLNPRHRAAHEYIGEAYLMVGNVRKAREHLTQLDRLCFFGCAEYSDLKKAIAEYEAKQKR